MFDLAIIGGGASGLAAAVAASELGDRVIILEASASIGRKILAAGNGRCNLMNSGNLRYYGDSSFAKSVLDKFGAEKQKRFWQYLGLAVTEDAEQRIYPCTYQSASVLNVLKNNLDHNNVQIVLNSPVNDINKNNDGSFSIRTKSDSIYTRRILVATGGPSGIRSRDCFSGYDILKSFGHTVSPLKPSLVSLITDQTSISGLSGIRCRCTVSLLNDQQKLIHREAGETIFSHEGISGICVMQCGRFIDNDHYIIELDLISRLYPNIKDIENELIRRKKRFSESDPVVLLEGLLPKKISYAVLKQAKVPMKGETIAELSENDIYRIVYSLMHYRLAVKGTRGFEDAQVTAGGAESNNFSPENMESLLVPGLHAAGEILNVDGDCGGFNLMFAFGSGILAGINRRNIEF